MQASQLTDLATNLNRVVRGKPEAVEATIVALLAGGSILLEDVPGVGKTTLARGIAQSIDLKFQRIQFTPDLLPADILGSSIFHPGESSFSFRPGPIFCQLLLADEINRASPRTQSALLEAMSENQVTIEGRRYPLPEPFFVLATQNPVEYQGTFPLPEAQLDRFLVLIQLGFPDPVTEVEILFEQQHSHPLDEIRPVMTAHDLQQWQAAVRKVKVSQLVGQYIVELTRRTRTDARVRLGVSPRGSLMLFRASQALAVLRQRDYVIPDDVQQAAPFVLPHRLHLAAHSRATSAARFEIVSDLIKLVPVPV